MGGSLNSRKNRFEGKVAVITGGGGVLCSAVAEALAKEGASIVLLPKSARKAVKRWLLRQT